MGSSGDMRSKAKVAGIGGVVPGGIFGGAPAVSIPMVAFDAAPSFKEAKEGPAELKDAHDKLILGEPLTRTSVLKHAHRAFEILSSCSEAQNVVASIASDPNIWNALMENSAVSQFICSILYTKECAAETYPASAKKLEDESEKSDSLEDVLSGFMQKIKLTVGKWVNDLSSFMQNIFVPPAAETEEDGGNTGAFVASAFAVLAVIVVMVVLMKRA